MHSQDGVYFEGRDGSINVKDGAIRFIVNEDSYHKLSFGNVGIRGVGPFDLTFTKTGIKGTVEGKGRSFACTWPDDITRPMFEMDGLRYFAGWADDHSIGKGDKTPQFSVGFGVTAGKHTIEIKEWTYPALPPEPARRMISF